MRIKIKKKDPIKRFGDIPPKIWLSISQSDRAENKGLIKEVLLAITEVLQNN
ncbi:MAG: hypothetical protein ABIK99_06375 [candidate division WOR-3 bacterium]